MIIIVGCAFKDNVPRKPSAIEFSLSNFRIYKITNRLQIVMRQKEKEN